MRAHEITDQERRFIHRAEKTGGPGIAFLLLFIFFGVGYYVFMNIQDAYGPLPVACFLLGWFLGMVLLTSVNRQWLQIVHKLMDQKR